MSVVVGSCLVLALAGVGAASVGDDVQATPRTTNFAMLGGGATPFACPARLTSEQAYEYNIADWGGDVHAIGNSKTGSATQSGMQSAACVWAAVCMDAAEGTARDYCLSRCEVAMGIAGMESNFNPTTRAATDGGYGLWQVGGPNAGAASKGFSPCNYIDGSMASMEPATPATCTAYNPITEGKWILSKTDNGKTWNPAGNCWTTCTGKQCNPFSVSSWTTGWCAPWAGPSCPGGGAQAYSTSPAVATACATAIASVYPGKVIAPSDPGSCISGAPSPPASGTCGTVLGGLGTQQGCWGTIESVCPGQGNSLHVLCGACDVAPPTLSPINYHFDCTGNLPCDCVPN